MQLAGTTLHELAHSLTEGTGHGVTWKDMTIALGFKLRPEAAGQQYRLAMFDPQLRHRIYALAGEIGDGSPAFARYGFGSGVVVALRPCSAGIGTKGGTSRGRGSGSRQRLWECQCPRPVKVRVASDSFQAH